MRYKDIKRTSTRIIIPPTDEEIHNELKKAEHPIKMVEPGFVRDIAEIAAGGEYLPFHKIEEQVNEYVEKNIIYKQESKSYFVRGFGTGYQTREKAVKNAINYLTSLERSAMIIADRFKKILREAPGSPLQRAIAAMVAIYQNAAVDQTVQATGLPLITYEGIEDSAGKLNDLFDMVRKNDPLMLNYYDIELLELNRIAMRFNTFDKFRTSASVEFDEDIDGSDTIVRKMRGYHEIHNIEPKAWAMPKPLLNYRLATKQFNVISKVQMLVKKQLIGFLLDVSGSMVGNKRKEIALGLLLNRCRAVMQGKAIMVFQTFAGSLIGEQQVIDDREKAIELFRIMRMCPFDANNTNIQQCLINFAENIKLIEGIKPEIVIVTDGVDEVSEDKIVEKLNETNTKLHAIIIGNTNDQLYAAANKLDGLALNRFKYQHLFEE
ncbi:hypothetical protein D6827_02800 [Candidatus Parcubacteria bacterium]|nr:MAG: hypothetical protein D6827_02800 [Candidatus Parcubacteria bacterium]